MNSKKAFTLIEFIVAMAILAIVTAAMLAYINPGKQLRKGRDAKRISDLGVITQALERYYSINNAYPANTTVLTNDGIIKVLPADPVETQSYIYWVATDSLDYMMCALMEEAEEDVLNGSLLSDASLTANPSGPYYYCLTNQF
jgi:prepilin-type N-terminal cleavage/methylation domain-containing protein